MKVSDLFSKQKRVVGITTETGRRTAYALKQSGGWREMMSDIYACENNHQLQKCRFYWAAQVVTDLWPEVWVNLANEEFDKAVEALAAQQAEGRLLLRQRRQNVIDSQCGSMWPRGKAWRQVHRAHGGEWRPLLADQVK